MLFSAEVRWFFPGPLPQLPRERFLGPVMSLGRRHERELCTSEPLRIDTYLLFPDAPQVGVKRRGTLFEVKARMGATEAMPVPGGGSGHCDRWCKVSMTAGDLKIGDLWPDDLSYVRHVAKRRLLRKYALATGPTSCGSGEMPASGCNVELVEVQLMDGADLQVARAVSQPWHSLAFEAFGEAAAVESLRTRALAALLPLLGPGSLGLDLDLEHSLAYPAWLLSAT